MQPPPYTNPQQYQQPPPVMRKNSWGPRMVLILAAALVFIVLVPILLYVLLRDNSQTCTVGLTNTAASITFQGNNANDLCNGFVRGGPFYHYDGEPGGTELCSGEATLNNIPGTTSTSFLVHYTVRDTGMFDIVGHSLCLSMQKYQAVPSGGQP